MFTNVFRLGKDAVVTHTGNGDAVTTLSLAYSFGYKDKKTTQWIQGTLYGKTAEALQPYLTAGRQVYAVLDDVRNEEYNGKTYMKSRIVKITLVGDSAQEKQETKKQDTKPFANIDDDVPF